MNERVAAGVYLRGRSVEVRCREILEELGMPVSVENEEIVAELVIRNACRLGILGVVFQESA